MPQRPTGRKRRHEPRRRPGKKSRPRGSRREPDLLEEVAAALDADEPLALLTLASGVMTALDPRSASPFARSAEAEPPPAEEVLEGLFELPLTESSALLAAIAGLRGDRLLQQRVTREIVARSHVLPRWLIELGRARPQQRVLLSTHVLGDGESLVFGVTLAGGHDVSLVVYVDHNLGTLVKDAFAVPGSVADLAPVLAGASDDPDVRHTELDPAEARARITRAIELGAMTFPPLESDTWPGCRPLVEWAVGLLPAGGKGYERREWTQADREALAERFLASPFGAGFDDAEHRSLLDDLLWFGADYGPGDPLRWSPVAVEIVLTDWIPRKIVADAALLGKMPDVLRALIRFSHAERGIRHELTAETLAALDHWEPDYQQAIRSPRLQGPDALLARVGALDEAAALAELGEALRELSGVASAERAVGGPEALAGLDDAPLPDEPFAWEQVPATARDRVMEVLRLVDRCCDSLLDTEFRTAARRLLARVAAAEPDRLVRGRPETAAAAVCWIAGRANRVFEGGRPSVKELLAFFGVGANTPTQRGNPMLRALGVQPGPFQEINLGSPAFLTSARRRELIDARERLDGSGE